MPRSPTFPLLALAGLLIPVAYAAGAEPESADFSEEERSWWAVQPVRDPAVPEVGAAANPVDAFLGQALAKAELQTASAAGAGEFVRRAYFDLHGLPPTPGQVDTFAAEWRKDQDAAIEKLIDELLASPRYGERWAQHWLDVVRYAESDGYREDAYRPDAYRYRDYVIRSINDDKPYDQFVREQLAADEFAKDDPKTLEATGFLRLGVYEWNQRDAETQREIMINEITNLTGEVFLGIGIGCARCHDHKFDPILQRDYYGLQAFLSSTVWPTNRKLATPEQKKALAEWEKETAAIRAEIDTLLAPGRVKARTTVVKMFPPEVQEMYRKPAREKSSYEQQISMLVERQIERELQKNHPISAVSKDKEKTARYQELRVELAKFDQQKPKLPNAFISVDTGVEAAVTLMKSGLDKSVVEPGFPALLGAPVPKIEPKPNSTGRRSALANWIASTQNPLASRVAVNRIWQHHFGKGIAASPNDFGTLGEPPSHPELLDWMASRFVEGGWKMKPMHRLIMTSDAYRRTARHEPGEKEKITDPSNRLLWRYPPRRLSAEQVRDAMLAVSGELKHREGGPSVDGTSTNRSVYVKKKRNTPDSFLHSFDAPAGFDSAPERQLTTTATQALLMANNDWPMKRARAFAKRVLGKGADIDAASVARAYRLAWGRKPTSEEVGLALAFIKEQAGEINKGGGTPRPLPRYPDENGLRPVAQNFGKVEGIDLGSKALWLQPGSRFEQLDIKGVELKKDAFAIEAVVQLDSLHKDASVNTLVSRWDGSHSTAGWAFGVTSEKSRYQPRNLILQLIGANPGGDLEYEVVASDLRVSLGRPVYVAAVIEPLPEGRGTAVFYLRDLSDPEAEVQIAKVGTNITAGLQNAKLPLLIGGRHGASGRKHLWDGQVGRISINEGADAITAPFANSNPVLAAVFDGDDGAKPIPGSSWRKKPQPAPSRTDPTSAAFADFCHALLSSNEFLYLH